MAKNDLPDGRVRQWTDTPGEVFRVEVGDLVDYRGTEGVVVSSDPITQHARLEGTEPTNWVAWKFCRIVKSAQELTDEANAPAPEPKGKGK